MSKIIYDLGNGKVKQLSNSSFDSSTNTLTVQKVSSNAVALNLQDGIIFSDNKILSSSVGTQGQIIAWDNTNSKWAFRDREKLSTATAQIPAESDVTGSNLLNAQIKSLSNVVSGTLPAARGGTGLTTADLSAVTYDALLVADGSNKLTYKLGSDDFSKPSVVADFTASSNFDATDNQNKIVLVKGQIADAPSAIFGSTKALSSSYDANAANYCAHIEFNEGYKGDFTAECWVYNINVGPSQWDISRSTVLVTNNLFGINLAGPNVNGTSGYYSLYTSGYDTYTNLVFIPNQWVHLALVRNGSKLKLYANATGSQEFDINNNNIPELNKIYVGSYTDGNRSMNGYITDFCFTKYAKTELEIKNYYNSVNLGLKNRHSKDEESTFYPLVIAPLSSNSSDTSIFNNTITLYNNTTIATPPEPLPGILTGSAMSCSYTGENTSTFTLNGSSQFIKATVSTPNFTGDFTVESWVYLKNYGSLNWGDFSSALYSAGTSPYGSFDLAIDPNGFLQMWNGSTRVYTNLKASLNKWQHIVWVRKNNKLQLFIDGQASNIIQGYEAYYNIPLNLFAFGSSVWGAAINGYMSEYAIFPYAKSNKEISDYYSFVMSGSYGRHQKDKIYNSSITTTTNRIQSAISINDSTSTKTNVIQGCGAGILTSTGIFNYYY